MTVSASKAYQIQQGTATPIESTITLLGTGTAGDKSAMRVLTHPDSANHVPITYGRNPDETYGMDTDAILLPSGDVIMTEDGSRVVSNAKTIEDVVVRERWLASGGLSMDAGFFRALIDYVVNPPEIDPVSQTYITYQPRDLNGYTFNIELVTIFNETPGDLIVQELIPLGGSEIQNGMADSDWPAGSGAQVKPVELVIKLVSKVT